MSLAAKYASLAAEPGPLLLLEFLKLVEVKEFAGKPSNPVIIAWADEVAAAMPTPYARWAADWYNDDAIAWCGLAMAVAAVRASQGRPERLPPPKFLSAKDWLNFGRKVHIDEAMLGDVLIFSRDGGGHVAQYVGEDDTAFHILGANQKDAVNVMRKLKSECVGVRRPFYNTQPSNVRKILYGPDGPLSTNEA
jgi:uncharacterized protein (TIGR02594 family)